MNDQELIERLRVDEPACEEHFTANLAADRIEELVKERDELGRRLNAALYGQPHFAWSIHEKEMSDLRFKLAKAVAALRTIAGYTDLGHYGQGATQHTEAHIAYVALAELEGEG